MKKLIKYGVAAGEYNTAMEAASHTYMTKDEKLVSTPLIFADNPFNDEVRAASVILDLGCGVGRNLKWILDNTNAHYIGLDPNIHMLKYFWEINKEYLNMQHRVTLVESFEEYEKLAITVDIVVCTFVFQHIGFRPPQGHMNVSDITKAVLNKCRKDIVWIMYEHDWEEQWLFRWQTDCNIFPQVYLRDYNGIPELSERGAHHLIIWKNDE